MAGLPAVYSNDLCIICYTDNMEIAIEAIQQFLALTNQSFIFGHGRFNDFDY